ncbi:hypothetical protein ACFQL0_20550 [Haloplanus litoreus]|uniref:WYL domain-containing protein n=1 Tax=Haloplanus litoreus TaxID=767515 RepID=A0ABD6A429_9EURY
MARHEKALLRVSQWLDLSRTERQEFVDTAQRISSRQEAAFSQYDEEYLEHLKQDVFTHEEVLSYLEEAGIGEDVVQDFSSGEIPFDEVYQSWNEIRYSVNEILDLTMLLKLVHSCSETLSQGIDSRYKFQKLVYLVNQELADQNRMDRDTTPYDHGKLEKTGFRYTYRMRSSGPFAKTLEEDKRRLYASNLIDEEVMAKVETPEINEENCRYRITLGRSGEVVMDRFASQLELLETEVLSDWEDTIDHVVLQFGHMTVEELHEYIMDLDPVKEAEERDLLLRGDE